MTVYAINCSTLGISQYSGAEFDAAVDIVDLSGETYVAAASAVFTNSGADDDGTDIDAYIKTGKLMAGDISAEKQVHHLWLTLAGTDDVDVTLYPAFWDGEGTLGPYVADALSTTQPHNRVVRGFLGEAGQWWSVKIANKTGGALDVRSAVLILDQTKILR